MSQGGAGGVTVVAVDPGSGKCGLVVVAAGRGAQDRPVTLLSKVVATPDVLVEMGRAMRRHPGVTTVVIGDGTQGRTLRRAVAEMFPDLAIALVDEHGSSQRARARYVERFPARGWQRLLPAGMRSPDRPYDDLVAEILAEEFIANQQKNLQQSP